MQFVRGSASSILTAAAQGAKLKILFSLFAGSLFLSAFHERGVFYPIESSGRENFIKALIAAIW
ncbi:MAG: hypothetical protein DME76_18475 [Verrucomicrobia bacterium]|nr:MAG: hypothetical protein DME76_18475 [Verrucomicrobiota bacterium]